jgi:hypothetical protein
MVSTISATVMARICSMVLLAGSCVLFVAKRLRWRGWDSNPRTPKGRDHSSLTVFLYVARRNVGSCTSDLESCAFGQASLPLRPLVLL